MGRVRGALCTFAGTVLLGGGAIFTVVTPPPAPTVGQAVGAELSIRGSYQALHELCDTSGDAELCSRLAGL